MKKVFLLSLSLVLGLGAFAQRQVIKNDVKEATTKASSINVGKEVATTSVSTFAPKASSSVVINRYVDMEEAETMDTKYDLQSNHYVANRMYQLPTGEVGVVATWSNQNKPSADRGTGYNFFDGAEWGEKPTARIEAYKTGWPSIAQWGENGEILLAHGGGIVGTDTIPSGMQCYVRETAGEGEWQHVGTLPPHPEGYPYEDEYPTWPRVITCGENHDIVIAVATLQHLFTSDSGTTNSCFWRTDDATDLERWEVSYGPLEELNLHQDVFSADDYALASNGHTVALIYSGVLTNSVYLFKSTDDGETWATTKVWEHPMEGHPLDEPGLDYGDTLFMPMNASITIDNNDVVHAAFNTFEMTHLAETLPGYYSYYNGRSVDGILYWNDTQDPIHDTEHPEYLGTSYEEHFAHPNQFHAARLWWPIVDEPGYVHMIADSTRWIGFIPTYKDESGTYIQWDNDMFYHDDYHSRIWGASGHQALSCDPNGNLACAFSTPCTRRTDNTYYLRTIIVSYRKAEENAYWVQDWDDLMEDFSLQFEDALFTSAVPNTNGEFEFWFSYQHDNKVGLYWQTDGTQTSASQNTIQVVKVYTPNADVEEAEAKDVVYNIYPNPATDYIMVNSAMKANATISFVNLAGQTVKTIKKDLTVGENSINIDLESGVYFCTISANGFTKTTKVIVK